MNQITSDYKKGQPQGIASTNNEKQQRNDNVRAGLAPALFQLNEYGQIAYNEWVKLSERFQNFELDVFQIMPNHIHGIIVLNARDFFTSLENTTKNNDFEKGQQQRSIYTISDMIGAYKSLVANACLNIYKTKNEIMGRFWQRNYYEHIILT